MTDACLDPLHYLVDTLCCRVYLDGEGNIRLAFSRRHGLEEMMTAQGIARSNASVLRAQLREDQEAQAQPDAPLGETDTVKPGPHCPLIT